MLSKLAHRGPDDAGIIKEDSLVLGHRRLSIMDVEGGHQPLRATADKLYAICNGEIYNYRELQIRHAQSYLFRTRGDSEILLPLYQKFGTQMTSQLDGMFSFVVSDGKECMAARDRVGIKPLYYGTAGDCIFFSSEIKALVDGAEEIKEFPSSHYYHHSKRGFFPLLSVTRIAIFHG